MCVQYDGSSPARFRETKLNTSSGLRILNDIVYTFTLKVVARLDPLCTLLGWLNPHPLAFTTA